MPQYKYKARTAEGKLRSGVMNAPDEDELHRSLRDSGLFPLSVSEKKSSKRVRQFKPKVLSEFCRQLGTLVGSGVTLVRALGIIASGESVKPKERAVYEELLTRIRQGTALSDAMEQQEGCFPPLMIYMLRSAESSGNLDQVCMKLSALYEKEHRMNSKVSSSLTYPKILAVMIVGVIVVLTKYVIPRLSDLFDQIETMPLSTRILLGISDFVENRWFLILAVIVALVVLWRALLTRPKVRLAVDRLKLHMPIIGRLQCIICTSRFAGTMSSLYSAGIPIASAMQIARKTVGNDYIDSQFDTVISFIRAGNNLSDGLDQVDGFVRKLGDSVRVGEETGSLDSMLNSTAESLEYDSDMALSKLVSYVEPVMLLVMGAVVAFVLVSVFSAIYSSYGSISGI